MFFVQKNFSHPFCWEKCFLLRKNRKVVLKIPKPSILKLDHRSYILHPRLSISAAPFFSTEWNRQTDKQTNRQTFFFFNYSTCMMTRYIIIISLIFWLWRCLYIWNIKFLHRRWFYFGNVFWLKCCQHFGNGLERLFHKRFAWPRYEINFFDTWFIVCFAFGL